MNPTAGHHGAELFGNRFTAVCFSVLLGVHAGLLAYSARLHSPTINEPAHLVAGLCHWRFGRFDVYRVNPPLVHYVAAIPVTFAGYNEDWGALIDLPDARSEFQVGDDFIRANGERSLWLFTIARWACIPFSLFGGLVCYFWSRELWGSNLAGLISLFLWCFDPNILAHGELITADCAAAAVGMGACYGFWRWLRMPTWTRAACAGLILGLAELTKTTWVLLFGIWPMIWMFREWASDRQKRAKTSAQRPRFCHASTSRRDRVGQLILILVVGLYVLNLGYGFDGSLTRLKDFTFVSRTLTGFEHSGIPGNRFADSWTGQIRVPVPKQFLRGIDLQKKEFENRDRPSFLRGEWKRGGWWYFYFYGLSVKTPHGSQLVLLLAVLTVMFRQWPSGTGNWHPYDAAPSEPIRSDEARNATESRLPPIRATCRAEAGGFEAPGQFGDLVVLLSPAIALLALASAQSSSNLHVRYVLPVLGFAFVFAGATATWFTCRPSNCRTIARKPVTPHIPLNL